MDICQKRVCQYCWNDYDRAWELQCKKEAKHNSIIISEKRGRLKQKNPQSTYHYRGDKRSLCPFAIRTSLAPIFSLSRHPVLIVVDLRNSYFAFFSNICRALRGSARQDANTAIAHR